VEEQERQNLERQKNIENPSTAKQGPSATEKRIKI
jgi:hypothetical protein